VEELWALGLPPRVRGTVWELALGNAAGVTAEKYTSICEEIAPLLEESYGGDSPSGESNSPAFWAKAIVVDLPRTYPVLAFFHEGGPLRQPLHQVLVSYAAFRPEIGYVQGMSYIVAMLLLNMESYSAFKCLANLVVKHPHLTSFFKMNLDKINIYFHEFDLQLQKTLPELHQHFFAHGVSLDMIIMDWFMTIFSKSVPIDIAARIWDFFMRDGVVYLFRAALGILKLVENTLLNSDFDECQKFLSRNMKDLDVDVTHCFEVINTIEITLSEHIPQ